LNDPWDCRPWFDYEELKDPGKLERHLDWLYDNAVPRPPAESREIYDAAMRSDPAALEKAIAGLSLVIQREISDRRIYCLTPHPDSILMWSHYADNHRGICLAFDTANTLFAMAREVRYRNDYPRFVAHAMGPDEIFEAIHTKSDAWSYEDEFRLLGIRSMPGLPMQLDGDFLPLQDGTLKFVILGCEANQEKILKFFKGHAPKMPLKRAIRANNQYRLQIAD
jgi:hypothetical protein